MKSKAAKYTEPPNTENTKCISLQCPVTRNKVRSIQVNSVRSQASSVSPQSSCESNKVQSSQESSMIAKVSSVPPQTACERNKIQNIQENLIGSKVVPSQSICDSSMMLRENAQLTVLTKAPKVIYANGQNSRFEENNAVGNVCQNAAGQKETLTSVKCDRVPFQGQQKPRAVERRTYSSRRNETGNCVTFQNVTPNISPVISARYADQRESQNYCAESKIADLRRGFVHQPTKNGSEIEHQNEVKTLYMGAQNSESTHQEQLTSTETKDADNLIQADSSRQFRDSSSNCDLHRTPTKEAGQVPQLDLTPCRSSGSGSVATPVATLTGNSLTIKSGTREVVLVFMGPSQSVTGRAGQTSETDHCNMFQVREISATTATAKSLAAAATATNTVDGQVPQDVSADQANGNSCHHSFPKVERPVPIILQANRQHLSATITEPQTSMAVDADGAVLEQATVSLGENAVNNKRDLIPIRETPAEDFGASNAYIGNTENLAPVREVSAQTLPRHCCRNEMCTGTSLYQNSGLQMQFSSFVPSSGYREDVGVNERTWLNEHPAAYQYGRDQLRSHEDQGSEAHFQTQVPLMGQHNLCGRLPSYEQQAFCNPYRDEFIDIAPEPRYHVSREPIGVLHYRRLRPSYSGQYAYHLPLRNTERARRTSFLDMRSHIYRRTMYPEQPFHGYDYVDGGNTYFLNRY